MLSPVDPQAHINLGDSLYMGGYYDKSRLALGTALSLSPGFWSAEFSLGRVLLHEGEFDAALAAFSREQAPEYRQLGITLAAYSLGRSEEFETAFGRLREGWGEKYPAMLAIVYAWTGNADTAFEWLDKAVESKDSFMIGLMDDPLMAKLVDDPRWPVFLDKAGFAPGQLAAIDFEVSLPN